ncbi:MAG: hypothetical protein WBZ36_15010 [Candidatus Nitrosopolaris sp.]
MKTISYSEAGFECDCVIKRQAEDEVIKNGVVHVVKDLVAKQLQMKYKIRLLFVI